MDRAVRPTLKRPGEILPVVVGLCLLDALGTESARHLLEGFRLADFGHIAEQAVAERLDLPGLIFEVLGSQLREWSVVDAHELRSASCPFKPVGVSVASETVLSGHDRGQAKALGVLGPVPVARCDVSKDVL